MHLVPHSQTLITAVIAIHFVLHHIIPLTLIMFALKGKAQSSHTEQKMSPPWDLESAFRDITACMLPASILFFLC